MITILYIGLAGCILFLLIVLVALMTKSKTTAREEESTINPEAELQLTSEEGAEIISDEEEPQAIRQIQIDQQISHRARNRLVTINKIAAFIILF